MAAGMTITSSNLFLRTDMEPFKLVIDWTGDADVALSKGIAATVTANRIAAGLAAPFPGRIRGKLAKIETVPGASGDKTTYIPYGTYAVTLLDAHGYDLLDGAGAARSISAAEMVVYETPIPVDEDLTLVVASTATADQLAGLGAFTSAATGWTLGSGWAYGTNNVAKTTGTGTLTKDTFAAVAGRVYDVTYTVAAGSWGTNKSFVASLGGASGATIVADGVYTDVLTATTTGGLAFTPTNTSAFTLDSVSVKYHDPQGRIVLFFE